MADKDNEYQLISIEDDGDEDEVVFHAGTRSSESRPRTAPTVRETASYASQVRAGRESAASSQVEDEAHMSAADASHDSVQNASIGEGAASMARPRESESGDAQERQAPKTAQERQEARRRAERRQLAEELAATEADLNKAGKMSTAQIITIIVCIILLIVGIVYVVQSFIS